MCVKSINMCFKSINKDGDLLSICRSKKDGKYHVVGDLAVTLFSLLSNVMMEIERLLAACGNRRVFIVSALPR